MRQSFEEMFEQHTAFSLRTFLRATVKSSLNKCREEIKEIETLADEGEFLDHELAEEYVDAMMCLIDSAARAGIQIMALQNAFQEKLLKNRNRKWILNDDNTYSHDHS